MHHPRVLHMQYVRSIGQTTCKGWLSSCPYPKEEIQVEVVRVIDISRCVNNPSRVDEFPSTRFEMGTYQSNPDLLHVGYDGRVLFALTTIIRNEGFGDLYLYNMDVFQVQNRVNPIGGRCCYRDPEFSPDGSYFVFAFQDIALGSQSQIELYYIPFGTISTGLSSLRSHCRRIFCSTSGRALNRCSDRYQLHPDIQIARSDRLLQTLAGVQQPVIFLWNSATMLV